MLGVETQRDTDPPQDLQSGETGPLPAAWVPMQRGMDRKARQDDQRYGDLVVLQPLLTAAAGSWATSPTAHLTHPPVSVGGHPVGLALRAYS